MGTTRDRFITLSIQSGQSPSPDKFQLPLSSCLVSWPLANTMATCCSYRTLKILSCCQEDLQICLTCTGKSGAEHSRHLKQSLAVWSGLHGADWYIDARVKEHHWYMPRTTGQAGYEWAQLQPGASHPTQKTPKSSSIFLLNGLYLHEGMRLNSIPATQTGRMAVPSGHRNLSSHSLKK
jgi:hypothetical protein